jgi:hypothetical protein
MTRANTAQPPIIVNPLGKTPKISRSRAKWNTTIANKATVRLASSQSNLLVPFDETCVL